MLQVRGFMGTLFVLSLSADRSDQHHQGEHQRNEVNQFDDGVMLVAGEEKTDDIAPDHKETERDHPVQQGFVFFHVDSAVREYIPVPGCCSPPSAARCSPSRSGSTPDPLRSAFWCRWPESA